MPTMILRLARATATAPLSIILRLALRCPIAPMAVRYRMAAGKDHASHRSSEPQQWFDALSHFVLAASHPSGPGPKFGSQPPSFAEAMYRWRRGWGKQTRYRASKAQAEHHSQLDALFCPVREGTRQGNWGSRLITPLVRSNRVSPPNLVARSKFD
ncbi:hypothetical protein BCV69DRAFT_199216 [Microstroma glucosiphilum]|uniref:Uncharacterized protein n=1 Tax=Pseudomicrostroma glucosiphilum TaxID=1684307 RepID=A0A316U6A5_9BASI|nr:hypothetical protein BCV69DRAFT_199216 [Pseudomicrostroma glucosiphilum]PWN20776.1 hypothetical protein BCV69DRAFT_199216 [Pseudomicrostroma glucosiphilum]